MEFYSGKPDNLAAASVTDYCTGVLNQTPALLMWGKNDPIFPEEGAHPYKRDLKNIEFHILNTGHFALEEYGPTIAEHMLKFLTRVNK